MSWQEYSLPILGVVLLVGLFIPALFERFRVPFSTALILAGSALGPHGLDYVRPDESLTLFAFLGATFHMLLAGFEAHKLDLRLLERKNALVFALSGLLPAAVGVAIGFGFGYAWRGAVLIGAIFLSSSVLLIFSFVRSFRLSETELGRRLQASAVLQDLAATLVVFVLLKSITPHPRFPLPILIGLILSSVAALRMFTPELVAFAFARFRKSGQAAIEQRVRFVLALMLLILFLYSALDVPAVVAAFLVGFSLASVEEAQDLRDRLHLISYALFIPVFLFAVGLDTNLRAVAMDLPGNLVVLALVVAAVVSKLSGGFLAGRLIGFPDRDALALGLGGSVKLAVPITATYAALKAGIIGDEIFTAVIVISVVTGAVLPFFLELILRGRER